MQVRWSLVLGTLIFTTGACLLLVCLATLARMGVNYHDVDAGWNAFYREHLARWYEHTVAAIVVAFWVPGIALISRRPKVRVQV